MKEVEVLNQELKFSQKEKSMAVTKAKDSMRLEAEKLKNDLHNVSQLRITVNSHKS